MINLKLNLQQYLSKKIAAIAKNGFCMMVISLSASNLKAQIKTDKFMGEIVNYDETAVPKYTLPEMLKTQQGKKVKDIATWERTRRPEILGLFEENIYGEIP